MSAGRSDEKGRRKGFFFTAPQAVFEQNLWKQSRRVLCLFILSPLREQTAAWWPWMSIICLWQATHMCSALKIGMPSHLFIAITHSMFENLFKEVGKALIQALACGAEQHNMHALSIKLHSAESWVEIALSILADRVFIIIIIIMKLSSKIWKFWRNTSSYTFHYYYYYYYFLLNSEIYPI